MLNYSIVHLYIEMQLIQLIYVSVIVDIYIYTVYSLLNKETWELQFLIQDPDMKQGLVHNMTDALQSLSTSHLFIVQFTHTHKHSYIGGCDYLAGCCLLIRRDNCTHTYLQLMAQQRFNYVMTYMLLLCCIIFHGMQCTMENYSEKPDDNIRGTCHASQSKTKQSFISKLNVFRWPLPSKEVRKDVFLLVCFMD